MKVIKFYPENRAKLHIGDSQGNLQETFSSDQLFSALYNNLVLLYGPDSRYISALFTDTVFSSLLYGIGFYNISNGEKRELFFLPRPLAPIRKKEEMDLFERKKEKKIKYISVGAYKLLQKSWQREEKYFSFNLLDLILMGNQFACTREEIKSIGVDVAVLESIKLFRINTSPKVAVSRTVDKSEHFFYQDEVEVVYNKNGDVLVKPFLYFFFRGDLNKKLWGALRLMADEGIGGKRSQGRGMLGTVSHEEWQEEIFEGDGDCFMTLSSMYPEYEDLGKMLYYEITERSGYLYSQQGRPLRKKRVRLLREGSIFSGPVTGKLIDIRPDEFREHEAYLNGKAFLISAAVEV